LGPYPALNFSSHPDYGALYGANFIQPASIINQTSYNVLGNPKEFAASEREKVAQMRAFFDENFAGQVNLADAGVFNPESDAAQIDSFIQTAFAEANSGVYNNPWGTGFMTGDMINMFAAEKIMQRFTPELMVVNMQDVDVCHGNFTQYAAALRVADYALAHLWQTIQSTPGMANNTILIAAPEHGRNLLPNTVVDQYGRYAIDHTSDATSREIFCLVVGPSGKVVQNQNITQQMGESIDIVPTIAKILGFQDQVGGMLPGQPLNQAFV
jgi:membrane-anchored protein YejM (alkaline phosphatase superfamily)